MLVVVVVVESKLWGYEEDKECRDPWRISLIPSLTDTMTAFLHNSFKSLLEYPSVKMESNSKSNAGSKWIFLRSYSNHCYLDTVRCITNSSTFCLWSLSGRDIANRFGILLKIALSISLGLFVAPKMIILVRSVEFNPSQRVMNSAFIMDVASWSLLLRSRKKESISSIKIIVGCNFLANENKAFTNFCDSPNHLSVIVETCKLINVAPDSKSKICSLRFTFCQCFCRHCLSASWRSMQEHTWWLRY